MANKRILDTVASETQLLSSKPCTRNNDEFSEDFRYIKRHAISNSALQCFQASYADETISKTDIFYYAYEILHFPEYKQRFESDLKKMVPHIPLAQDFWAFSKAGRELAQWHLNYETIEHYSLQQAAELDLGDPAYYPSRCRNKCKKCSSPRRARKWIKPPSQ